MQNRFKSAIQEGNVNEANQILASLDPAIYTSARKSLIESITIEDLNILKKNEMNPKLIFAGYGACLKPDDDHYVYRMDSDDKFSVRYIRTPAIGSYSKCLKYVNELRATVDLPPFVFRGTSEYGTLRPSPEVYPQEYDTDQVIWPELYFLKEMQNNNENDKHASELTNRTSIQIEDEEDASPNRDLTKKQLVNYNWFTNGGRVLGFIERDRGEDIYIERLVNARPYPRNPTTLFSSPPAMPAPSTPADSDKSNSSDKTPRHHEV